MRFLLTTATAVLFSTAALAQDVTPQTLSYTYDHAVICDLNSADISTTLPASGSTFNVVVRCNTEFDLDLENDESNTDQKIVMKNLDPVESTSDYIETFDVGIAYTSGLEAATEHGDGAQGAINGTFKAQNGTALYTLDYTIPSNLEAGNYAGEAIVVISAIDPLQIPFTN